MSDFHASVSTAGEPKPGATVQTGDVPDFGTYKTARDLILPAPTGGGSRIDFQSYGLGQDDFLHWGESQGFITAPLAAQTLNGAWSARLRLSVQAVPLTVIWLRCNAALFRWGADDTLKQQIGVQQTIATDLTANPTNYDVIFTVSQSITFAAGERLYLSVWPYLRDSSLETGVLTFRIRVDDSAGPTRITTPGTALLHVPQTTKMALCGVGA